MTKEKVFPLACFLKIIGPSCSSDDHIEWRFRFKFKVLKGLEALIKNDTKTDCRLGNQWKSMGICCVLNNIHLKLNL